MPSSPLTISPTRSRSRTRSTKIDAAAPGDGAAIGPDSPLLAAVDEKEEPPDPIFRVTFGGGPLGFGVLPSEAGLMVVSVDGPALGSGVEVNDMIVELGGAPLAREVSMKGFGDQLKQLARPGRPARC